MATIREPHAPELTLAAGPARRSPLIPLRYQIIFLLFIVTTINNADRATTSVTGADLSKLLHMDKVQLGFLRSALGWSYVAAQLPGG